MAATHSHQNPADLLGGWFGFLLQRADHTRPNPADLLGGSFGFPLMAATHSHQNPADLLGGWFGFLLQRADHACPNPADLFGGSFGFLLQRADHTRPNPADLLGGWFGFPLQRADHAHPNPADLFGGWFGFLLMRWWKSSKRKYPPGKPGGISVVGLSVCSEKRNDHLDKPGALANPADLLGGWFGFPLIAATHTRPNPADLLGGWFGFLLIRWWKGSKRKYPPGKPGGISVVGLSVCSEKRNDHLDKPGALASPADLLGGWFGFLLMAATHSHRNPADLLGGWLGFSLHRTDHARPNPADLLGGWLGFPLHRTDHARPNPADLFGGWFGFLLMRWCKSSKRKYPPGKPGGISVVGLAVCSEKRNDHLDKPGALASPADLLGGWFGFLLMAATHSHRNPADLLGGWFGFLLIRWWKGSKRKYPPGKPGGISVVGLSVCSEKRNDHLDKPGALASPADLLGGWFGFLLMAATHSHRNPADLLGGWLGFSLHRTDHARPNPADLLGGWFGFLLQRADHTRPNPADLFGGWFGFLLMRWWKGSKRKYPPGKPGGISVVGLSVCSEKRNDHLDKPGALANPADSFGGGDDSLACWALGFTRTLGAEICPVLDVRPGLSEWLGTRKVPCPLKSFA